MIKKIIRKEKLTDCKWINLFQVKYKNSKDKLCEWIFASRNKDPFVENKPDAVVIVATINTSSGLKLVVTKEFRVPIQDYEYGFPAGLIDNGMTIEETVKKELKEETGLDLVKIFYKSNKVISAAGLSDESVIIVFVEAKGTISNKYQEDAEDIETFLYGVKDINSLLKSDKKIGGKAWGILYHFSKIGRID